MHSSNIDSMRNSMDSEDWEDAKWRRISSLAVDLIKCWCENSLSAHAYCNQIKARFFSINYKALISDMAGFISSCQIFEAFVSILKSTENSIYFMDIDRLLGQLDDLFVGYWTLYRQKQSSTTLIHEGELDTRRNSPVPLNIENYLLVEKIFDYLTRLLSNLIVRDMKEYS